MAGGATVEKKQPAKTVALEDKPRGANSTSVAPSERILTCWVVECGMAGCTTINLTNLDFATTEDEMSAWAEEKCGPVASAKLLLNRKSGKPSAFCDPPSPPPSLVAATITA